MKVLAEGPRAVARRMTADASFSEPAGSKHEYDQVVIALSSGQISLTIDGKAPKREKVPGRAQSVMNYSG